MKKTLIGMVTSATLAFSGAADAQTSSSHFDRLSSREQSAIVNGALQQINAYYQSINDQKTLHCIEDLFYNLSDIDENAPKRAYNGYSVFRQFQQQALQSGNGDNISAENLVLQVIATLCNANKTSSSAFNNMTSQQKSTAITGILQTIYDYYKTQGAPGSHKADCMVTLFNNPNQAAATGHREFETALATALTSGNAVTTYIEDLILNIIDRNCDPDRDLADTPEQQQNTLPMAPGSTG